MRSSNSMPMPGSATRVKRQVAIALIIALTAGVIAASAAGASAADRARGGQAASTQPTAQGGPDDFGYTYRDSNEPGGPIYEWIDVSSSGTLVSNWTSYDDGYAGPIPIGFSFNYYGTDFTALYAGSNGYITFDQGTGYIPHGTLPSTDSPNNDSALFGGDMYLPNYGTEARVYYQTLTNPTRFVLQYTNLHYCCGLNTPHTFEVVLYPGGDIQAQYKTLNGTNSSYVGIENAAGTDGLGYSASLADSLAIRYYYPRGVFLAPVTQSGFGLPGEVVTYTLQLANQSGVADSFDLAVQPGNTWPTTLSLTRTGVLTDGASLLFDAWVSIPVSAVAGDADEVTIAASSVTSPTAVTDSADLNTTAVSGEVAYVPLSQTNLVALVDTTTHAVLDTVDVGAAGCAFPWRTAIMPNGSEVYVSCYNSDNVVVISASGYVVSTVVGGIYRPDGLTFTRDGAYALVGSRSASQLTFIDVKTHAVTTLGTPGVTRSIVMHPYRNQAYVTCGDGTVLVLDTTALVVTTAIPAVGDPWDIAVSPDGLWVYAGGRQGGGLAVIDTLANSLRAVVTGLGVLTGLEVAPDGSVVYASSLSNGVHVIDAASLQHITTISGVGQAWKVTTTCQGNELWVGNSSSSVPIVDTTTFAVTHNLAMPGSGAKGIGICPQRVANGVLLTPPHQTRSGAPGEPVAHELTVINSTGRTDTFQLSLGPSQWPAALSTTTVGPLADGQTATVDVIVTIPSTVSWYETDTVDATVTSVGLPTYSASASITTEANAPPTISVVPSALTSTQMTNQIVEQGLEIRSGNGLTLTVALNDVDLTPDTTLAAPLDLPLAVDAFGNGPRTPSDNRPVTPPQPAHEPVVRTLAESYKPSTEILAGEYFTTTVDNEDNNRTGNPDYDMDAYVCGGDSIEPIEFNILVDRVAGPLNNVLTIRAYDIDTPDEVDQVRLNGHYLGDLVGADETWTETAFVVPAASLVVGANLVEIDMIGNGWCGFVDWGELFIVSRPAAWLSESPQSATIPSNSSQPITVTFDATGLQPKEYLGAIVVTSNDPVQPSLFVPVTMTVAPTPDMGRVAGTVSDAWTGRPMTATVELEGIYTVIARPSFEVWATAGAYSMTVSASGYVSATLPIVITPGGTTIRNVALEPAQVRLEWSPDAIDAGMDPYGLVMRTLTISNTGAIPMDVALFEINLGFAERRPAPEELAGKRILYDRAHGQPSLNDYTTLVNDAVAAGAVVDVNWYFPIDSLVLDGYDILWTNCCGDVTWGLSELLAVNTWLREGGAVFVQGEHSPATAGPASIFGLYYFSATCTYGWTNNITAHPITAGVSNVNVDSTCWRISPSPGSVVAVYDPAGQPHVVAKEHNGGKIVVVSNEDFTNWSIGEADNRLLANNILAWLARPAYSDVPWLITSPVSSTIPPHSSLPVSIVFDGSGLDIGTYRAALAIEHPDPTQTFPVELSVTLTVFPPQNRPRYFPLMLRQ